MPSPFLNVCVLVDIVSPLSVCMSCSINIKLFLSYNNLGWEHCLFSHFNICIIYFLFCFPIKSEYFIVESNEDTDEMLHRAAYHLGLQCLPKYLSACSQFIKG